MDTFKTTTPASFMLFSSFNQVLVLSLIFVFVVFLLQIIWKQYYFPKTSGLTFIPNQLPLFGHVHLFLKNPSQIQKDINEICSKLPSPLAGWFFNYWFLVVYAPEDMEIVFNKCLTRGVGYNFFKDLFGDSIVIVPGHKWKPRRKILSPTFNQKILNSCVTKMSENAKTLADILEKYKNTQKLDIYNLCVSTVASIMTEFTMGVDSEFSKHEIVKYAHWLESIIDAILFRLSNPMYVPNFIYNRSSQRKKDIVPVNEMNEFLISTVSNKKQEMKNLCEHDFETLERKSLLEQLIEISKSNSIYTDERMRDELCTMMFAGTHTSSACIYFTLILLAMHKDIENKVYEEVMEIVGADRVVEHSDIPKLVYLDRIIKESLRLYPIGGMLVRKVDEPITLHNGVLVPKDTMILLNIKNLHFDAKSFPDPMKFDPDRFLPEECAKRHPYSYLPFAGGPRNCIGGKLALMSMTTVLATLIARFEFFTDCKSLDDIKDQQDMLIQPLDGSQVNYKLRK